MVLSQKFEDALCYAAHVHAGQTRKGTEVPYLSHLMAVASLVLDYGGDEEQAIAALLHDAVEDAGGVRRLEDIRLRFGEIVAAIVDACTDTFEDPKPPWRQRKAALIIRIPKLPRPASLVCAADKLHDVRTILSELRQSGEAIWTRFKGGKDGTLWYNRCLVQAFRTGGVTPVIEELDRVVTRIEQFIIHEKQNTTIFVSRPVDMPAVPEAA
jgi:(p)ppGpp synthase/HD superfamily hydrolase